MIRNDRQTRSTSATNQRADDSNSDRQKLYDGFVILARIIAREIARESTFTPETPAGNIQVEESKPPANSTGSLSIKEKLAFSPSEAGKLLGLSTNIIYQLIHQNKIPFIRYGRRFLIPHIELKRQLNDWHGFGSK